MNKRGTNSSLEKRFWTKINKDGPLPVYRPGLGSCWLWEGTRSPNGYGSIQVGYTQLAHRVAYELLIGPIPEGLTLDHLCRVRACVNPKHLEPVSVRENILRGVGLAAMNVLKTHCPQGHTYDILNTYFYPDGKRACRTCRRLSKSWRVY